MSDTTWDGVPIAVESPRGSAVVVSRDGDDGPRYLILHRAVNGPRYEGPWAWTPPSGMRQPGEAVYTAVLRELREETGLSGIDVEPVDVGRGHALLRARITAVDSIRLDAEHDRLDWITVDQARARCRPEVVADGIVTAAAVPTVTMAFRPVTATDLPLISRWSQRPHLRPHWFPAALTCREAAEHYGPCVTGESSVTMRILTVDGVDAGIVQTAPVSALPQHLAATGRDDAVAIGFAVAEARWCGVGLGPQLIWRVLRDLVPPEAATVVATVADGNPAARRALLKAGFDDDGPVTVSGGRHRLFGFNPAHWWGRGHPQNPPT